MSITVNLNKGEINANFASVAEAKLALKELRLKKKEYQLQRKIIAAQQTAIRAEHTNDVRRRGSMVTGGGWIGKMLRAGERASRDAAKASVASRLRPLELQKEKLDSLLRAFDDLAIKIEQYILANS